MEKFESFEVLLRFFFIFFDFDFLVDVVVEIIVDMMKWEGIVFFYRVSNDDIYVNDEVRCSK